MRKTLLIIISFISGFSLSAQSLKDISFGTDNTFDIVTWNIEWFAKDGQKTADSVARIIRSLDAEILALQEISDTFLFNKMINKLDGYRWFYDPGYYGGLAYVFKSDVIEVLDIYEIYTNEAYWHALPRAPLVLEIKFRETKYIIINNHLKCCGDGLLDLNDNDDEEKRRLDACMHIKYHIDTFLPNENVILLGDLNDVITDIPEHNVFQSFIDDSENYMMADMAIAEGNVSGWSYPGWPSHIDHIILSNELIGAFVKDSSDIHTIKIEDYIAGGFPEYDSYISDHRPLAMKLQTSTGDPAAVNNLILQDILNIYPNPSRGKIQFTFNPMTQHGALEIYSMSGERIARLQLRLNQSTLTWNPDQLRPGIYLVRLSAGHEVITAEKLVIIE